LRDYTQMTKENAQSSKEDARRRLVELEKLGLPPESPDDDHLKKNKFELRKKN
jgi:hypothetical protein